ncbi:MAG: helix-hairpin-helix domain-containing protein [Gammaproteobacteria bacterium]
MKPAIIDIPGIGPAAAAALDEHGIKTLASLARAPVETITAVPGFSEARAERVILAASELLAASATNQPDDAEADEAAEADSKGKKDKKNKRKGKGKGKKDKGKKGKKGKGKGKGKKKGKK